MYQFSPGKLFVLMLLLLLTAAAMLQAGEIQPGIFPVEVTAVRDGFLSVVIEDAEGNRVANLASEVKTAAGPQRFIWDLYDVGNQAKADQPYTRRLVKPGVYRVRGLSHTIIDLRYEASVNSPGQPPWKTEDLRGAWMGDHSMINDCLYLPAGHGPTDRAEVLLASQCAESGYGLAWVDGNGRKRTSFTYQGWAGAYATAIDTGPRAVAPWCLYTLDAGVLRAMGKDGKHEEIVRWTPARPWVVLGDFFSCLDVAVRNGVAVIANSANLDNQDAAKGNLLLVDVAAKKILANVPTGPSRGVAFGPDGLLYATLGNELVRYRVAKDTLVKDKTVIGGLVEPQRPRFDASGNLYLSVWGDLHQVQVYDKAFTLVRTIGKPGGAQIGAYDETRMDRPQGLTIDGDGRLWVAENSHLPKRVSQWNAATGAFIRAWYGGPQYGGGGSVDPKDPTIFYYPQTVHPGVKGTLEFKVDFATGQSKLMRIVQRSPLCNRQYAQNWKWNGADLTAPASAVTPLTAFDPVFQQRLLPPPFRVGYAGGRRWLSSKVGRADTPSHLVIYRLDAADPYAIPVAMCGTAWDMFRNDQDGGVFASATEAAAIKAVREKADATHYLWTDRNGDQLIQASEVQFLQAQGGAGGLYGPNLQPDMSITMGNLADGLVPFGGVDERGVPRYDLAKRAPLAIPDTASWNGNSGTPLVGSDSVVLSAQGWDFFSNIAGYRRGGTRAWSYRCHFVTDMPRQPGQVIGGDGILGDMMRAPAGEAGEVWITNNEKGACYLFTSDGLFIKTLGGDVRTTPLWRFPEAKRGMSVDGVTWEDECFLPSVTQAADGRILIVTGKEHCSITSLHGLESVKRHDWGEIRVTPGMLAGLPEAQIEAPGRQGRQTLMVATGGPAPVIDGKMDEWAALPGSAWATIDHQVKAALWISEGRLHAVFVTKDAKLLDNSAQDLPYLFKGGGAVEVLLGATWDPGNPTEQRPLGEGDCRLVVAKVKGKPTAMLYRPISPGAPASEQRIFVSPIGKQVFASVREISGDLIFAEDGSGTFEFSVPLASVLPSDMSKLGRQAWHTQNAMIQGDLGIIRGNGVQNVQRVRWNDSDTGMTSDIPTEASFNPFRWGILHLIDRSRMIRTLPACPPGTAKGLRYDLMTSGIDQAWGWLDSKPASSGGTAQPDLSLAKAATVWGLRFRGVLTIPAEGSYRIRVSNGTKSLRLAVGGRVLCDVPGPGLEAREAVLDLKAGPVALDLAYAVAEPGFTELKLEWAGPNFTLRAIPEDAFTH